MKKSASLWSAFLISNLVACGMAGRQYHDAAYQQRRALEEPVIKADDAILSEEAIRTLLSSKIKLPAKAKLAVVNLGHRSMDGYYNWYNLASSEEFLQTKRELLDALEKPLLELGRFTEISHVPDLLYPEKPSLIRLREAAALMQAHLLLVYKSRSQLITDWHIFSKDEIKSHASVDLVLMDVKTGAIPYAETLEAEHLEKEQSEDASGFETRKRADKIVTLKVMKKSAEGLRGFFAQERQ